LNVSSLARFPFDIFRKRSLKPKAAKEGIEAGKPAPPKPLQTAAFRPSHAAPGQAIADTALASRMQRIETRAAKMENGQKKASIIQNLALAREFMGKRLDVMAEHYMEECEKEMG